MEGDVDLLCLNNVIVEAGNPVDVIMNAADDIHADLIVLGSQTSALGLVLYLKKYYALPKYLCTWYPIYLKRGSFTHPTCNHKLHP